MGCKRTFYITDKEGHVHRVRVFSEKFAHPFVENPVLRESSKLWRKLRKIGRVDP